MMNINMGYEEFRTKLHIMAFTYKDYLTKNPIIGPVNLGEYRNKVKEVIETNDANSYKASLKNKCNPTTIVGSDFNTTLTDFTERISAEFSKRLAIQVKYVRIKCSIRYPLTPHTIKNVYKRLGFVLAFKDSNIQRFYPTIIAKRTVTDCDLDVLVYLYVYIPMYDFINHKWLSANDAKSLETFVVDSLYDIIGDSTYCKEIDFKILNAIHAKVIENAKYKRYIDSKIGGRTD